MLQSSLNYKLPCLQILIMTEFTKSESQLLAPFFTNLDRPIFALRNLPEVLKGALFSRYSRTEKSLRRVLLEEFITAPEVDFFQAAVAPQNPGLTAQSKAEAFYDRVLIGYGDDSVAELGGAHLACEEISNIAAKILEDSRLGLSPLEKSTRYVPFNKKVNGRYRYYREPAIMASRHGAEYEMTLDRLFDTHTNLFDPLLAWVKSETPRDDQTSERAYLSATRAKTFDLLRGLLPMATLTNVGFFGNGRAFEYLLVKLAASVHAEVNEIGRGIQQELDMVIPSFVKRAKSDRGQQYAQYLANNVCNSQKLAQKVLANQLQAPTELVTLVEFDPDAESQVVTAILYPHSNLSQAEIRQVVDRLTPSELQEIINTYAGDRQSRFHRPGRAFEETYYTFDILADLGAYRDLHRHRVLTQERQTYTVDHGFDVPEEVLAAGMGAVYQGALEQAAVTMKSIEQDLPAAAQYVVPFAFRTRWRIKLNLREAYHFIELRSAAQGHPGYRSIAQAMYKNILEVHPTLAAKMSFVDLAEYRLERLSSEQKLDLKIQKKT
jgi:thymidylate synthase ThyX